MPLKNIHFDSAIRGAVQAKSEMLQGIFDSATAKLAECGLTPDAGLACRAVPKDEAGRAKGSENFNGRNVLAWIENIPAVAESAEEQDAHRQLLILHATIAARLA